MPGVRFCLHSNVVGPAPLTASVGHRSHDRNMVGITAIFAFLGILMGLVTGMWWGFSQNWLIGIAGSAGGAVAGGITGCIAGFLSEEIPEWIRGLSKTHRALGTVFSWAFWLLYLAAIIAFAYGGMVFLRHMRHH